MTDFDIVKSNLAIAALVLTYGGERKRNFVNPSPCCGHNDCFSLNDDENLWKCFSCSKGGSVIDLVMAVEDCDEAEALRRCAEKAGIQLKTDKRLADVAGLNLTIRESIFIEATEYYHSHMLTNGGKQYLIERRRHKEETLREMKVGWTDGALAEHLKGKGFSEQEILASNLARLLRNDEGCTFIVDLFPKNIVIFPHVNGNRIEHFTIKDPLKGVVTPEHKQDIKWQLPADAP